MAEAQYIIRVRGSNGLYKSLGAMMVRDWVIAKNVVSVVVVVARLGAALSTAYI